MTKQTGDDANLWYPEDGADFGLADFLFLELWGEKALHRLFDLLLGAIDDIVLADIDFFALGDLFGIGSRRTMKPMMMHSTQKPS